MENVKFGIKRAERVFQVSGKIRRQRDDFEIEKNFVATKNLPESFIKFQQQRINILFQLIF